MEKKIEKFVIREKYVTTKVRSQNSDFYVKD